MCALSSFLYGRPRELNPPIVAVPIKMRVDELGSIVRINAPQAEGQLALHQVERCTDARLAVAHHGSGLDPGRVNVREIERIHKLAVDTVTGMRDEVDFGKPGDRHAPALGL